MRQQSWTGLAIAMALLLAAAFVSADTIRLKDGTVLEGTAIPQGQKYWVKTTDGKTQMIDASDVASITRGGPRPPADKPAETRPAPAPEPAPRPDPGSAQGFAATRQRAEAADSTDQAREIWQKFIDSKPAASDLAAGEAELEKWKSLAEAGAEKINGKWLTGDALKEIISRSTQLGDEGDQLLRDKQVEKAMQKFEEALAVYPGNYKLLFAMGYLSLTRDKDDAAIGYFERALKAKPDLHEATANLGIALVKRGQHEKGIQLLVKTATERASEQVAQALVNALVKAPKSVANSATGKSAATLARDLSQKYGIAGATPTWPYIKMRVAAEPPVAGRPDKPTAPADPREAEHGIGFGTGFFVSADGLLLTNRHVARDADKLSIFTGDGQHVKAEVVSIDQEQDLALLRVKVKGKVPFLQFSQAETPREGAECVIMGYPLADRLGVSSVKVTRGIVSSINKEKAGPNVMLDAKVNPGNSGGPVLDKDGNVMAIVSMKTLATETEDTYGLGISTGRIRWFLEKNTVKPVTGAAAGKEPSTEQIVAKAKGAVVCIMITK